MQTHANRVPASLPADPAEVSEALEIAKALWDKGDPSEALRWIRRAVEAADEAGDVQRMAALARGAADLEESLAHAAPSTPASIAPKPPPTPMPSRPSAVPPPSAVRINKSKPPPLPAAARRPTAPPSQPAPPSRPAPISQAPATNQVRPSRAPEPAQARVRVSIKTSVRDPTLLVARRLADGQPAPAGAHEAFLVLPEGASLEFLEEPKLNGKGR